jgi:hypothetical protein
VTGLCPICQERPVEYLDHSHITGRARGWLCKQCNFGLGSLGDSPETLDRAAAYLRASAIGQTYEEYRRQYMVEYHLANKEKRCAAARARHKHIRQRERRKAAL